MDTANLRNRAFPVSRTIWWQWVVGNVVGWLLIGALGSAAILIADSLSDSSLTEIEFSLFVAFAYTSGCVLGAAQWFILKRWGIVGLWWIMVTGLGMLIGMVISRQMNHLHVDDIPSGILWLLVEGSSFGSTMGLLQWLILRQRIVDSKWWIWANMIGWGIAPLLGLFLFPFWGGPPFGPFGGIAAIMITGWVVVRISKNTRAMQINTG